MPISQVVQEPALRLNHSRPYRISTCSRTIIPELVLERLRTVPETKTLDTGRPGGLPGRVRDGRLARLCLDREGIRTPQDLHIDQQCLISRAGTLTLLLLREVRHHRTAADVGIGVGGSL